MPPIIAGLRLRRNTLFCQKYLNLANRMPSPFANTAARSGRVFLPAVARHLDFVEYEASAGAPAIAKDN